VNVRHPPNNRQYMIHRALCVVCNLKETFMWHVHKYSQIYAVLVEFGMMYTKYHVEKCHGRAKWLCSVLKARCPQAAQSIIVVLQRTSIS
jgi:hypothetical protein